MSRDIHCPPPWREGDDERELDYEAKLWRQGPSAIDVLLVAFGLLCFAAVALAGDVTYSDSALIQNRGTGQSDLTTRVDNGGDSERHVTVQSGGRVYDAGKLAPGERARVHVIESPGAQPVIIFDKER